VTARAADIDHLRRIQTVRYHESGLHAALAALFQEQPALMVNAAEVNQIGIARPERIHPCRSSKNVA